MRLHLFRRNAIDNSSAWNCCWKWKPKNG